MELPWKKVHLPHDWTIEEPFDKNNNTTQGFLPLNIGWYKKGLIFPEFYANKKIIILFDGCTETVMSGKIMLTLDIPASFFFLPNLVNSSYIQMNC